MKKKYGKKRTDLFYFTYETKRLPVHNHFTLLYDMKYLLD